MRYTRVRLAALAHVPPPHVVTSDEIEARLAPVYGRLGLPEGRLELMTGIRERRFFDPGTKPGTISAVAADRALDASGLDRRDIGALLHGSVCRDRLEPATACAVYAACGLSANGGVVYDLSNACLGLLNGVVQVADLIELGRLRAGVVVGTETGRDLVEGTIESLLAPPDVSRADVKLAFASLTIGSGSAAIVLCDESLKPEAPRLLGGAVRADTTHAALCTGGDELDAAGRPRMATDSEALLHAGVGLARRTWDDFLSALELRGGGRGEGRHAPGRPRAPPTVAGRTGDPARPRLPDGRNARQHRRRRPAHRRESGRGGGALRPRRHGGVAGDRQRAEQRDAGLGVVSG